MASFKEKRIIIAENAPVIAKGLATVLKWIPGSRASIIEANSRNSLLDLLSTEVIDILIINPTFGGLLHPNEIRKKSLNQNLKLIAIEIGKLSNQAIALYDEHVHVTDDITTLTEKIFPLQSETETIDNEKNTLSTREKEIVSFVVKGYTNQEIADKLFLSIHTVITHRRNIAKKLEIHSATGLTIYAIVNKIVDLSEIKI